MIKVTENLKSFIGDITGLNVKVPSYYRTDSDNKWVDLYVLFKDNILTIGGGGVDAIMFHRVETEGEADDFEFSVDKKRFFEAVKFYGKDFTIQNEDNQYLRLTKNSKAIRLFPSSPHPVIKSLIHKSLDYVDKKSEERLRIKKEEFAIARNFTSEDRIRESLLNVCLRKGHMYGTDGHVLCSLAIEDCPKEDLIITQYSPIDFDYDTYLHKEHNYFIFSNENTVIFQNKITSKYPDVERIIDHLDGKKISFKRKDALYAFRFLSGMGKGGADIIIKGETAKVTFCDLYNIGISDQAGDVLKITNQSDIETRLRFNLQYLIDVIKSITVDTVKLYIPEKYGSPCYVKEKNNIYVIMPVAYE